MKIGIKLDSYPCPLSEQILLMKKYGFSATFAMSDRKDLDEAVTACRDAGIEVESLHAPAADINLMWDVTDAGDARLYGYMADVDACKRCGVTTLALHPSHKFPTPPVPLARQRGSQRRSSNTAKNKKNGNVNKGLHFRSFFIR